jgi:hypothetical protein
MALDEQELTVHRYRVRIGKLFKAEPSFTLHLVRLMAAENDFITAVTSADRLSGSEDLQSSGQRVYFFRLSCAHLHEAIKVLKHLGSEFPQILSRAPADMAKVYNRIATTVFPLEDMLARLRHNVVFHYIDSELRGVLREWGEEAQGETVIGPEPSHNRQGIADEASTRALYRAFQFPTEPEEANRAFENLMREVADVQVLVIAYVRILLHTVMKIYPGIIEPMED